MRLSSALLLAVFVVVTPAIAQHGTAESGYWPMGYNGDTWTGVVTAVDDATREITLAYVGKKKTETFVCTLPDPFNVKANGTDRALKPSDIPLGTRLKIYYMKKTVKTASGKKDENLVVDLKTAPTDGNKE